MKKKIIIASATVLFAVATMFNMNLLQGNSVGDVSLDDIAVMAQAQAEGDTPQKYAVRTELKGTAVQTIKDETGHIMERTCGYTQIVCRGVGDLDCTESFDVYDCSKWKEVYN